MIVKGEEHSFQTSVSNSESRFVIPEQSTGLLMEMLRKQIYTNPFESVLRELLCNARDANREAGVGDNALRVRCEDGGAFFSGKVRTLVFEDDGPGITPERMREVYTQYGASTKRGDNKQTGGFGLGAKSPFSVVDTFFIETVTDGVERTYQAALDAEGGRVVELSSVTTGRPNGTRVKVPFSDSDVKRVVRCSPDAFQMVVNSRIKSLTKYWKERVVFNGVVLEKPGVLFETDRYAYLSENSGMHGIILSADGIGYEIEPCSAQFRMPALHSDRVVLKLPAGALQLSPSREDVTNCSANVEAVQRALDEFDSTVLDEVEKYLSAADTYAEAFRLTMKLVDYSREKFVVNWKTPSGAHVRIKAKDFLVYEYRQNQSYRSSCRTSDLVEGKYPEVMVTGTDLDRNLNSHAFVRVCNMAGVSPEEGFLYIENLEDAEHHAMMGAKIVNISSLENLNVVKEAPARQQHKPEKVKLKVTKVIRGLLTPKKSGKKTEYHEVTLTVFEDGSFKAGNKKHVAGSVFLVPMMSVTKQKEMMRICQHFLAVRSGKRTTLLIASGEIMDSNPELSAKNVIKTEIPDIEKLLYMYRDVRNDVFETCVKLAIIENLRDRFEVTKQLVQMLASETSSFASEKIWYWSYNASEFLSMATLLFPKKMEHKEAVACGVEKICENMNEFCAKYPMIFYAGGRSGILRHVLLYVNAVDSAESTNEEE